VWQPAIQRHQSAVGVAMAYRENDGVENNNQISMAKKERQHQPV